MKPGQTTKKPQGKAGTYAKKSQNKTAGGAGKPRVSEEEPATFADANLRDTGELNFQKPRKKRRPDPKITFFELFKTRMERDGKTKQFSFRDQLSRGMKWGLYKVQVMRDKLDELNERWNKFDVNDPKNRKNKGSGSADRDKKPALADISRADPEGFRKKSKTQSKKDSQFTEGMQHAAPAARREGVRWRFNPPKEDGISSEQVGPERQVELSDEPFPLAAPKVKAAPMQIAFKPDEKQSGGKKTDAANDDTLAKRVNKKAAEIKDAEDAESKAARQKNNEIDEAQM